MDFHILSIHTHSYILNIFQGIVHTHYSIILLKMDRLKDSHSYTKKYLMDIENNNGQYIKMYL